MTDNHKTALITGSTGGLGRAFAHIHAARGGRLILSGRSLEKLISLKEELISRYGRLDIFLITADLSSAEGPQKVYDECRKKGILPDYLINNAGFGGLGKFTDRPAEKDQAMLAVNITAPTVLMKLFLPDFLKRGSGRILNISSTAALGPGPLQAMYFATKAYLTSLSNALWYEYKDTGITITALMPGAMDTGFAKAGGLEKTKMFSHSVDPRKAALDGYNGMLEGKINVISGLPGWQKPFVTLMPMMPKKALMKFIADQQS